MIASDIDSNNDPSNISFNNNNNTMDSSLPLFPEVNNNYSRVAMDTDGIEYGDVGDKRE